MYEGKGVGGRRDRGREETFLETLEFFYILIMLAAYCSVNDMNVSYFI